MKERNFFKQRLPTYKLKCASSPLEESFALYITFKYTKKFVEVLYINVINLLKLFNMVMI